MIYFLVLIILLFLTIRFDFTSVNRRSSDLWYYIMLVVFILIAGFRFKVGGDTLSYFRDFDDIPFLTELSLTTLWDYKHNPFWTVLSSISKTIINDFAFFQLIHAIFINLVFFKFIKENTIFRFTAILFYYLFAYLYFNMEIMRESFAIAFFLLAYPYYKNKKWMKYFLLITVAILFHFSAFVLLLFPLFKNTNLNLRNILYTVVAACTSFILLRYFPILDILLFSKTLSNKYEFYSNYTANINGMIGNFLIYGFFPLIVWLLSKRVNTHHDKFKEFFMLYFTMVIFYVAVSGFGRFINYLTPFMIIFFSDFLNELFRSRRYRPVRMPLLLFFITLSILPKFFYYARDTSDLAYDTHRFNTWYPYSSIFEKEEFPPREVLHREGLRMDRVR